MGNENKHKNYEILNLLGYGLAKFDTDFINNFGYKTKSDFYAMLVTLDVADTSSTIKNRQDLFDPFFENGRKGWWQKGDVYIHRKHLIDSLFGALNSYSYSDIVKVYLQEHFRYKDIETFNVKPIIKSQFKQLQKTGLEAEIFFINNYKKIGLFENSTLEDTRLFGDGYDFQIETKDGYYLAEVKGVRERSGPIRLTKNEYLKADEYKNRYILSVVSNLSDKPKITIISNPLKRLDFNKTTIEQKQTTFNTKNIAW